MVISQILVTSYQPSQTNVVWAKPIEGGFTLYLFNNGRWQPVKIVNDLGTATTDDDTVADISNIDQVVEDEVTRQMAGHDEAVGDTHNTESPDEGDYPDLTIFGEP